MTTLKVPYKVLFKFYYDYSGASLMLTYQLVRGFHETYAPSNFHKRIQERSCSLIQRARLDKLALYAFCFKN